MTPYNPAQWNRLCLTPGGDDSIEPQPAPDDAQEALDQLPPGARVRFLTREVPNSNAPMSVAAFYDRSDEARLGAERERFPTLWARVDSTLPRGELSSYTRLVRLDALESWGEVGRALDAVILLSPAVMPVALRELPGIAWEA